MTPNLVDRMKHLVEYAYKTVLHADPRIQVDEMDDRSGNTVPVVIVDGGFYLYPTQVTRNGIAGPVTTQDFAVDVGVGGPDFFDVPDVIDLGQYQTMTEAITRLISELVQARTTQILDDLGMAEAYGQEEAWT